MKLLDMIVNYIDGKGETTKLTMNELLAAKKYTVLYFYPKDNTPGCTIEAKQFSDALPQFQKAGAQVIGVSKDGPKSHCNFQKEQELTLGLISDKEKALHEHFEALGPKKFMGKEYMGTLRNTYLLDNKGAVLYKWEEVTPLGHANEVLEYVKGL